MDLVILVNSLTNGGAERVASLWAKGFVSRGFNVSIIIKDSTLPITYHIPPSIKIYSLESKKYRFFNTLYQDWQIRKIIKKIKPVYLVCVLDGEGIHAKIATLGLKIKIIQTEHNSFERPNEVAFTYKQKILKFYVNRLMPAVTVLTKADKKCLGDGYKNVFVLPNPLAFLPANEVPQKQNIILAAGRLDAGYTKGFDILIKAWAKISNKYPKWKLIIAGGGTEQCLENYKNMCLEYRINKQVEFIGFTSDILSLYKKSAIFVLSSRYEGFGMVLIEAMSQGCACIACDYKGRQREIIHDKSEGIICNVGDVNGIASSMELLINDKKLRDNISLKAIERAKDFELKNIMTKWMNILKQI